MSTALLTRPSRELPNASLFADLRPQFRPAEPSPVELTRYAPFDLGRDLCAPGRRASAAVASTPEDAPLARLAPAAQSSGAAATPTLRLTRRGRLLRSGVVLIAVVAALTAVGAAHGGDPAQGSDDRRVVTVPTTVVAPGDTLWSIAQRVAPGTDPRRTVVQLQRLNNLDGAAVSVGQVLQIPVRG